MIYFFFVLLNILSFNVIEIQKMKNFHDLINMKYEKIKKFFFLYLILIIKI